MYQNIRLFSVGVYKNIIYKKQYQTIDELLQDTIGRPSNNYSLDLYIYDSIETFLWDVFTT